MSKITNPLPIGALLTLALLLTLLTISVLARAIKSGAIKLPHITQAQPDSQDAKNELAY
jgi:hypothetical protein